MPITIDIDCDYEGCNEYLVAVVSKDASQRLAEIEADGWVVLRDSTGAVAATFCPNHKDDQERALASTEDAETPVAASPNSDFPQGGNQ